MKSSGNTRRIVEVVSKNTKERREERVELHTRAHTEFLWTGDFLNLEGGEVLWSLSL